MRSQIVKVNHVGSVVSEIFGTHTQTDTDPELLHKDKNHAPDIVNFVQGAHPTPPSRPPKPAGLRTNSTGHQSKVSVSNSLL